MLDKEGPDTRDKIWQSFIAVKGGGKQSCASSSLAKAMFTKKRTILYLSAIEVAFYYKAIYKLLFVHLPIAIAAALIYFIPCDETQK